VALSLFAVAKYANDSHRRVSGREMRRVRQRPVIDRLRIVITVTAGERELTVLLHNGENRALGAQDVRTYDTQLFCHARTLYFRIHPEPGGTSVSA